MVLPNRISIPLVGESQLAQLRFPIPKVRLDLLSAALDMLGLRLVFRFGDLEAPLFLRPS